MGRAKHCLGKDFTHLNFQLLIQRKGLDLVCGTNQRDKSLFQH